MLAFIGLLYKLTLKVAYENLRPAWRTHYFESLQMQNASRTTSKGAQTHERAQTRNKESKNGEKIQRKQASH